MNDVVETLKARAGITFEDGTRVQCTEFSKLVIDEFVYDPATSKGKLALKASAGTVRYASGLIAKNSKENIKVKTPTASVAVRGTDFSMTVDELGRSLVILLPSGPGLVGTITVSNVGGEVIMNKPFQATLVSSATDRPSNPVILNFADESKINNMLILDTPKSVTQASKETKKQDKVDKDNDTIKDEKTVEKTKAREEVAVQETKTLEIEKLDPEANKAAADAISKIETLVVPTITVNDGFTTDGVNAILFISNTNVVQYKLKADTNATLSITNKEGTKDYNLNFGSKLKINIIQR